MTLVGAREGAMSGIRRAVAAAMARDLPAFVLPGPSVARAMGLDLSGSHLRLVGTPRHADLLIVVGPLPPVCAMPPPSPTRRSRAPARSLRWVPATSPRCPMRTCRPR